MICKNCGSENAENVKFCTACGSAMPAESAAEAVQTQEAPVTGQFGQGGQFGTVNGMPAGAPGMTAAQGATPGNMPGGMPGGMQGMPGGAQGATPGGVPGSMPGGAPIPGQPMGQPQPGMYGGMQGNMQGNMPGNMQGGMPGNMQGGMQGVMPNGMPGARPMQTGPMYQMPPMQAVPPAQPKKGNAGVKAVIIIIVVLLLLCVGVLAAIGISKKLKQGRFDDCIQTAEEYRQEENYRAAINSYQDALEIDEENDEAIEGMTETYIEWANSLADDGKYEEALDVLEDADKRADRKAIKKAIEEIEASMMTGSSGWSDADFVFTSDSESVTVSLGHTFRINTYYEKCYFSDYYGDYDEYDELFATSRGLEPGMTLQNYIALYDLQPGYAVWERYSGDNGEYTSFMNYTGQSGYEMYDGYVNVWLDVGYCKENGEWRLMEDTEVRDVWFCDAPLSDYDEVVILSVNVYEDDVIWDISMEHFTYNDAWVIWQDWD